MATSTRPDPDHTGAVLVGIVISFAGGFSLFCLVHATLGSAF